MALWPNGRYMTCSTYKGYGVAPGLDARIKANGDRMNRFIALNKTASTPDGYGAKTYIPPITTGSMSCWNRSVATFGEGTSTLLQGGPMEGTGAIVVTQTGSLSLTVGMSSNTLIVSLTGNNKELKLTIGLGGTGAISLTGTNNLSMVVPFAGSGSVVDLTGVSNLKGNLNLAGEWTPFTELSPENLAAAVWNSLLSQFQDAGSAGEALASAGSGGVNYNALAQAVWEYTVRELTTGGGGGITVDDIMTDPRALTVAKFIGLK